MVSNSLRNALILSLGASVKRGAYLECGEGKPASPVVAMGGRTEGTGAGARGATRGGVTGAGATGVGATGAGAMGGETTRAGMTGAGTTGGGMTRAGATDAMVDGARAGVEGEGRGE